MSTNMCHIKITKKKQRHSYYYISRNIGLCTNYKKYVPVKIEKNRQSYVNIELWSIPSYML
jgi:hypothetical protein